MPESPARDGQHSKNGDAEREQDRDHIIERHIAPSNQQRIAKAGGEDRHPGRDAGRHHNQAQCTDAKTSDQCRGDDLAFGSQRGEGQHRKRHPDQGPGHDVADHQHFGNLAARTADMGDGLGAGELHGAQIGRDDSGCPAEQVGGGDMAEEDHCHQHRRDAVGGGEKWRKFAARDQLGVA